MAGVEGAETAKAGVDHPELVVSIPGELVNVDVAGDVDTAGKIAPVVLALGLELLRHGRHVVVLPDGIGAADRQPVRVGGDAHRLGKRPEVGIQAAAIVADHDHLACLVRGDDQTDSELVEEGGQIGCVHAAQFSAVPEGRGVGGSFDTGRRVMHVRQSYVQRSGLSRQKATGK